VVIDPDREHAASHITWDAVYAGPCWTLDEAAVAMIRGGFRHLVVVSDDEVLGVISVRDIVRVWAENRSTVPA
jgi:CBS domain-containing protein